MNTAVLMEIESLRRASLAGLREKYRKVVSGRKPDPGTGNICFEGLPRGCRLSPKAIAPNGRAGAHG